MAINPVILQLTWDRSLVESVDQSQRWILSAMQANGPALVRLLWRILGNETDVCDAYQDLFVRLANMTPDQKPKQIRAYLFRAAANLAVSMLRREKLRRESMMRLRSDQHDSYETDPGGDLDTRRMQQQLRNAIARLPDYLGDVVALRDLGEMPYSDVARILGITPGAARVYRHKAIQLLAVWLNQSIHHSGQTIQDSDPIGEF
ncbi:MAG TPA: RNA polymerase sigma factor [Phycisphaerales bacterium]|nr:RNA polymerase sigma factor [Phycisphaerales bacterium]